MQSPIPTSVPRHSGVVALTVWAAAKIVVLGLWLAFAPSTQHDVSYYFTSLEALKTEGVAGTLPEYPVPALGVLLIPYVFAFGSLKAYVVGFILTMVILDAGFTWGLWKHSPTDSLAPVWWWIAFTFLMGPTAYMRFDLVPAVLAGTAILFLAARRPGLAGGAIGVGAAVKLWPALLFLALLGRRDSRLKANLALWGSGAALAAISLLLGGWDRLVSPLTWQKDRGLHVESIWASAPMLERLLHPSTAHVGLSPFKAFEVTTPSSTAWLTAADFSVPVGLVLLLLIAVVWVGSPLKTSAPHAGLLMVLTAGIMIVTNKTFSPQYLMWMAAPTAAVIAISRDATKTLARKLAIAILVLTLLTQIVYPIGYDALVRTWSAWTHVVTFNLIIRNLALVALVIWCGIQLVLPPRRSRG